MAKLYVESISGLASYQLPVPLVREIGRIVVRWAYFEYCVQEMNWQVARMSPEMGRTAMREPRVTDRLEMLQELIDIRHASWDVELYKSIRAQAGLLAAKRDLLAHGIWHYQESRGEWLVQLTRGSWPKNTAELVSGKRKITPESILITPEILRSATKQIDKLSRDLKRLRESAVE